VDRPDPVALLEAQDATREPDLVPVRHGRMLVSPFTFYRGAAKLMAADLKDTPTGRLRAADLVAEETRRAVAATGTGSRPGPRRVPGELVIRSACPWGAGGTR
jgi:hypothetical protein